MINNDFNSLFLDKLISVTKKKSNLVNYLMDITFMSKEAAYRRLRGEVPFTLSEACLLASKLNISLDDIMSNGSGKLTYELKMDPDELIDYSYQKLYEHEESYNIIFDSEIYIMTAWNAIPYSMFLPYENLSKIYFFKWTHLNQQNSRAIKFANLPWPDEVKNKVEELGNTVIRNSEFTYIFDRNIFRRFMNEIKHFRILGMISDNDLSLLNKEFIQLIDHLENISETGASEGGNKFSVYLSNIDFEHNYTYVKGNNFEQAYMDNIYMMNTIYSSHPKIVNMHKYFIESLKKYSTQISISGELERQKFFEEQRKLIL